MRGFYSIIICSFLVLSACDYRLVKRANSDDSNNSFKTKPFDEETLISASLVRTTILKNCMSCHVGRYPPELGSLSGIESHISRITTVINSNFMPPQNSGYAPLSSCYKAILGKWAQLGLVQTSKVKVGELAECKGKTPSTGTDLPIEHMPLTYQTLLTKILQPKCLSCHNPDSDELDAREILFYPYEEIKKRNRLWSTPGANSKIVRILSRTDEDRMPPPESGAALSAQEIQFIIQWLDLGAPE